MNAGAWGRTIGNLVEKVKVMDYNGKIKEIDKKEVRFSYRDSSLKKYIILSVRLKLPEESSKEITKRIRKYRKLRLYAQGDTASNAGCIFRNPPGLFAGHLIDSCGLKGRKIGGALISRRHANFILNQGSARCQDVLGLMELIKRKVRHRFNIRLKPEIKVWK